MELIQQFGGTYGPAAEPGAAGSLQASLLWLQATLLGSVATAVGVIAIATVGFLMLQGRVDLRRGAQVVLGLFVLFGAHAMAAGLQSGIALVAEPPSFEAPPVTPAPPAARIVPPPPPLDYDPYAGASVHRQGGD